MHQTNKYEILLHFYMKQRNFGFNIYAPSFIFYICDDQFNICQPNGHLGRCTCCILLNKEYYYIYKYTFHDQMYWVLICKCFKWLFSIEYLNFIFYILYVESTPNTHPQKHNHRRVHTHIARLVERFGKFNK